MYRPFHQHYQEEEEEEEELELVVSTSMNTTTPTGELDLLLTSECLTFPEEEFALLTSSFSEVVNQQQQQQQQQQQLEEFEEEQLLCALPLPLPLQQEAACLLEFDLSSSPSSSSSSPLHLMTSTSGSPSQEDSSSPWMDLLVTSPQTQSTFTSIQSEEVLFNSALELEGQHHQYGHQLSPPLTYSSDDSNTKTNTKPSRSTSTRKSKLTGDNIKSESKVVDDLEDEEEFSTKSKKGSANARTRKRQRKGDATNENQDVSAVTLTRDQLLHFTSQDLDNLARNIANTRDLTTAEQKELKKQRRLIKNRESAQASRERKKMYVDELEGQINVLKMDNSKLMDEVKQLRNENLSLRDEVKTLHSFIKKSDNGDSQISFGNILSIKKPDNVVLTQKLKTAGVTLLIILFSFGLFFNNLGMMKSSLSPALSKILVEREEIPAVLTNSLGSIWSNLHLNPRLHRKLMSEPSPQFPSRSLQEKAQSPPSTEPEHLPQTEEVTQSATVLIGSPTLEEVRTAKRRDASPVYNFKPLGNQSYNFSLSDELSRKRRLVTLDKISQPDGESVGSIFMSEFSNESSSLGESKGADMVRWFNDNVQPKPNTAYMACSDVQQIIPTNSPPLDPNSPFFVSFLIPSSHTHNDSTSHPPTDNIMMEVTCQIVDISISHGFPQTPHDDSARISV